MISFKQIPSDVPYVEVEISGSGVAVVQVSSNFFYLLFSSIHYLKCCSETKFVVIPQ